LGDGIPDRERAGAQDGKIEAPDPGPAQAGGARERTAN
jgi:hypothetical protein